MALAGDADRERVAASLREHFVRGRLTLEELTERTELALRARSRSDLRRALDELPQVAPMEIARSVVRGAALVVLSAAWLVFSFVLLLVLALTVLIHGASAGELAVFLLVWLVPTLLVSRLWRRGISPRPRRT
jgi:Flp pilus assembly protein TadB